MKIVSISSIGQYFESEFDYFICTASFEDRCLSVAKNIDLKKFKNSFLFVNLDQISSFEEKYHQLKRILSEKSNNFIQIDQDSNQPIENISNIFKEFDIINSISNKSFVVDVTTFTHETLLILYRVLKAKGVPSRNITYLYNNANNYSINENDADKKWLSVGNKEIRSVLGYSGFMSPLKKNALIVLVGFEPERTRKLIETYEPSMVSLGVGIDHCTDDESSIELNRKRHRQLVEELENAEIFEFSVNNPESAKLILKEQYNKFYADYNIVVAPMNNKVSTLGVASFACENPEIQLCYIPALYYNSEGYSSPGSKCLIFQMI